MLTREQARRVLVDHVEEGTVDCRHLTDRDILELILHMLIESRRRLNKSGPVAAQE